MGFFFPLLIFPVAQRSFCIVIYPFVLSKKIVVSMEYLQVY